MRGRRMGRCGYGEGVSGMRATCVGCAFRWFSDGEVRGVCGRRIALQGRLFDDEEQMMGTGFCWVPEGCMVVDGEVEG